LPDLVGLGFALVVLNIHPWISWPRRLVDGMAAATLPGFAKKGLAHALQVGKANVSGFGTHLLKDFFSGTHYQMVSIVIPSVNYLMIGNRMFSQRA
jgi:hypothetical protein